jgi:N-acetylmuramoyl-L-alanine amidase
VKPQYIVIHHSLTKDGLTVDWDAICRYHVETLGYKDIGYNWGVERVGGILVTKTGRPWNQPGAHAKEMNMNHRSLGICVVGNFDLYPPDIELLRHVKGLCFAAMVNFGIPANAVIGHREVGMMAGFDWEKGQYKSCPGKYFPMDTLRQALAGKIDLEWRPT